MLARSRLGSNLPYRSATLILGANLPDIDVLAYAGGADAALLLRRGWTHGPIGLLLLPPLLVAALVAWQKWRRRSPGSLPVAPLLALAYLAALSHPLLDWLNTYGVRLLSPFSDRWFYGDALFIVDPWFWLILGAGLFLTTPPSRRANGRWIGAALACSLPLLAAPVSLAVKATWIAALVALVPLRRWRGDLFRQRRQLLMGATLALWLLYLGAMVLSARAAHQLVAAQLHRQGFEPIGLMAGPLPATPWTRDVVVELAEDYRIGRFSWLDRPRLELEEAPIPKPGRQGAPEPANFVATALQDPSIEGFMNWVRFPYVEIARDDSGIDVFVIDARYLRRRPRGPQDFGAASVRLPATPQNPAPD